MSIEDIANKHGINDRFVTWHPTLFFAFGFLFSIFEFVLSICCAIEEGFLMAIDVFKRLRHEDKITHADVEDRQKKAYEEYKNEH